MVRQGSQAGRRFPPVERTETDSETGVEVRQLTDFPAHSNHLYLTNDGRYDGGRRLLFNSDRAGAHNLYSVELATGAITQLTDLPALEKRYAQFGRNAAVDSGTVYFWYGECLLALDLETLAISEHYRTPEGFTYAGAHNSVTADGEYVCTSIREPVGASSSAERWEARPTTQILRIPTDGSEPEVLHQEKTELSHTNASPTRSNLLTYAQEGPWDRTTQRIWGLDMETGETWKIRPEESGEMLGHEFWLADGERIGYHGRYADGDPFFGVIRYDNTGRVEQRIPRVLFDHEGTRGHVHTATGEFVVSDGTPEEPYLFVWRRSDDGDGYEPPRKLVRHDRRTFQFGRLHVHPRVEPGGEVLFLGTRSEYANLYVLDIPEYESLPQVET